jgi:SAM-dependent methyltransferase
MSLLLRTWLAPAKLRRRVSRNSAERDQSRRAALIERIAPGRSFLDMGGMWAVDGEYAFVAERAGASSVVLCDGMDPTEEFERKRKAAASRVRFVQGDLHDPGTVEQLGTFDVVWCTGVLYHSPDPYRLIEHLRRLTHETLILGTRVVPELPGVEGGCVFYPALSESSRRAFAWLHGREAPTMLGAAAPFDRTPAVGYANYWWGITPSALLAMLNLARFRVTERYQPHPLSLDVVAHVVAGEPVVPALDFSRKRGERVGGANAETRSAL